MVNIVWALLIFVGLLTAAALGNMENVTQIILDSAIDAAELCLKLSGIYALWLGLMRVAQKSALVDFLANKMTILMKPLFPDIPLKHPAMGSMAMNIMANVLGIGNAAAPFGLKAMSELQNLNTQKDRATNAMCMFLVINTASVQLIPTTVIAIRSAAGSIAPAEIIGSTLVATILSFTVAIAVVKKLERYF